MRMKLNIINLQKTTQSAKRIGFNENHFQFWENEIGFEIVFCN